MPAVTVASMRSRVTFVLSATAVAVVVALAGFTSSTASAASYPSWDDVQNAKANEASKNKEVQRIQALIASLQAEVAAAQEASQKAGAEYQAAQFKFDEADQRATDLTAAAAKSQKEADDAKIAAGRLAAQLYRSGGTDLSMNLMLDSKGGKADQLLSKLGNMSKLVERSSQIYEKAQQSENEAKQLLAQAEIAKVEREKLKTAAQAAFDAAVAAQQALEAKLAESGDLELVLQAQLAALQDVTAQTVSGYEAGVAEAKRIAEERARAEAAARGVAVSDAGWARPGGGWVSDWFGPRQSVWTGYAWSSSYHRGIDLAQGCGSPIYAASGGQVAYAGWYGSYGNFIIVNHGGGITSAYAHIRNGGYNVGVGDYVGPGQTIAYTGTTGSSTGCHLHFEIRQNGSAINPAPFMQDRGVSF